MAAARASMITSFGRCGFNDATSNFLFDQGFIEPVELTYITQTDVKDLVRNALRNPPANVEFPFMAVKKLLAYRFWVSERLRTAQATDPASFTAAECSSALQNLRDSDERQEADKDLDVTKADSLKTTAGWVKFNEKFLNYLAQLRGRGKTPLTYLIREHDTVTAEIRAAVYTTVDERLINTTTLTGNHFLHDNTRLWKELKVLTCDGTGWSYIKKFDKSEDGRAAYRALKLQCEGTSASATRKKKGYNLINSAKYSGERKNYNFTKYVEAHQTGYNEIIDAAPHEQIAESKRVDDFLDGIIDPSLQSGKDYVYGNAAMLESFEATQQYLGTIVANRKQHDIAQKDIRGVAGAGTKRKLEDRYYETEEWVKLTPDEKTQVKKMAAARKLKEKNKKRRASALKLKNKQKQESKGNESSDREDEKEDKNENAGDQFGRKAHKNK